MTKTVLLLSIILVIFTACKKESSPPAYFFSFEIGGAKYSFDGLTVAPFSRNSGFHIDDTATRYYHVSVMSIVNGGVGFTGVYNRDTSNKRELAEFVFTNISSTDANRGLFYLSDRPFTFSIDEQTDTYISGTFEGLLIGLGWVTISNGQFRIPFKH